MQYSLCKIDDSIKVAFTAAINEFLDKDSDSLPATFTPLNGRIVDFDRYCRGINSGVAANCLTYNYAYVSNNTHAVVGVAAIRVYANDCDERQNIGDVELALRPTLRNLGLEEDFLDIVLCECDNFGVCEPLFIVRDDNTVWIDRLTDYYHKDGSDVTKGDSIYKRITVILPD